MPVNRYFEGKGEKVMHSMKETYGAEKGKKVFYATANKNKKKGKPFGKKKPFGKAKKQADALEGM